MMPTGPDAEPLPVESLSDLVEQSGYFDAEYYQEQRSDLRQTRDLARHYVEEGWRDNLNPSPLFDTASYREANEDVRSSGINPLLHYLRWGKAEGRVAFRAIRDFAGDAGVVAVAPSNVEWAALPPARAVVTPVVDVIVPVYRGFAETMRCLYSILTSNVRTAFELCVIDDASPETEIESALNDLAAAGHIRLVRNAANLGFVQTCNFAMQLHPGRDVVLLNSDTVVFGDWLDRLRATALLPNVGTVTPFSNNAEICSYPAFIRDNNRPLELPDAELDRIFADENRGEYVDLPTGVGFCMYVRRECLDTVGLFDYAHFGQGYGEENDFCRRALRCGWRSVLAADVFVRHHGGASFGESKVRRVRAAIRTLARLHPNYDEVIRAFVHADPIRAYRQRVDIARIRRAMSGPTFLFVTHNRGGGTERHVTELAERIDGDGGHVIFCRAEDRTERLRFEFPSMLAPNLPLIDVTGDVGEFVSVSAAMGISHLHIHHLADFPPLAADFFRVAAGRLTVQYDVTVHDYFFVCPRITLIDVSGFYCGEPDEAGCTRCLSRHGSEFGAPPIWTWRDRYGRLLTGARMVFVPDEDVRSRLQCYFPTLACVVRPHPEALSAPALPREAGIDTSSAEETSPELETTPRRRRIGVIGGIGPHKGSRLLLSCAQIARERELPIEFSVIGTTDINAALREAGVAISGTYSEDELDALINDANLDMAWFPSVWPETYCYTLSAALRCRVFPVAFDLGAIATRLRRLGWGHVMPIKSFFTPERVLAELATLEVSELPAAANHAWRRPVETSFISSYYELSGGAAKRDGHTATSLR